MKNSDQSTVLVVDDEQRVAECYKIFVEQQHNAEVAIGGREAVEKLDENIDIVLLDRRMPDLHGSEVIDYINEEDHACRVIIISAIDPDMEILKNEFVKYIKKPVEQDELLQAIQETIVFDESGQSHIEYLKLIEKAHIMQSEFTKVKLEDNHYYNKIIDSINSMREQFNDNVINDLHQKLGESKLEDVTQK